MNHPHLKPKSSLSFKALAKEDILYPFSKGVTLTELLIATALSSVIFILIINILIVGLKNRTRADITSSLQKTSTNIINDISKYARWANSIQVSGNTLTITTSNNQLINYYLSGPNLIRNLPTTPNVELNPDDIAITEFKVIPYPPVSPRDLTISLKLQHKTSAQYVVSNVSTIAVRITTVGTL